jgi:hypothetical protein
LFTLLYAATTEMLHIIEVILNQFRLMTNIPPDAKIQKEVFRISNGE